MILTLEATGPQAAQLGSSARKVFDGDGGTIGRSADNSWVLAHPYVSSRHARIRYQDGRFTIEDLKSSNGVFINSLERRLPLGERHALQAGDTIFIDPFEIQVSIEQGRQMQAPPVPDPFLLDDPFAPSAPAAPPPPRTPDLPGPGLAAESIAADAIDPLQLLGLDDPAAPARHGPRAADLAGGSVIRDYYRPPDAPAPPQPAEDRHPGEAPAAPARSESIIPDDYNPLVPDDPGAESHHARPVPRGTRAAHTSGSKSVTRPAGPAPGGGRTGRTRAHVPPPPAAAPPPAAPPAPPPAAAPPPLPPDAPGAHAALDLSQMLAGAGLDPAAMTPELARSFGRILRVVVAGLMEALQARQRIKDEFGMRLTMFRPADNNPLKFSANVDDALHNLLVKRNAAYLGPVDAFEDAFADIRNHQMAMLAGMRQAFDTMLAAFNPERIEAEFERQTKKGALLAMPGRLRYWDLYREKFGDMVRDPEACFAELFGDEFARAYEEQLERLKSRRRTD